VNGIMAGILVRGEPQLRIGAGGEHRLAMYLAILLMLVLLPAMFLRKKKWTTALGLFMIVAVPGLTLWTATANYTGFDIQQRSNAGKRPYPTAFATSPLGYRDVSCGTTLLHRDRQDGPFYYLRNWPTCTGPRRLHTLFVLLLAFGIASTAYIRGPRNHQPEQVDVTAS
jgi:hypothetical protein